MPAKNHLSQKQRERLLKTLKEQENPYISVAARKHKRSGLQTRQFVAHINCK